MVDHILNDRANPSAANIVSNRRVGNLQTELPHQAKHIVCEHARMQYEIVGCKLASGQAFQIKVCLDLTVVLFTGAVIAIQFNDPPSRATQGSPVHLDLDLRNEEDLTFTAYGSFDDTKHLTQRLVKSLFTNEHRPDVYLLSFAFFAAYAQILCEQEPRLLWISSQIFLDDVIGTSFLSVTDLQIRQAVVACIHSNKERTVCDSACILNAGLQKFIRVLLAMHAALTQFHMDAVALFAQVREDRSKTIMAFVGARYAFFFVRELSKGDTSISSGNNVVRSFSPRTRRSTPVSGAATRRNRSADSSSTISFHIDEPAISKRWRKVGLDGTSRMSRLMLNASSCRNGSI